MRLNISHGLKVQKYISSNEIIKEFLEILSIWKLSEKQFHKSTQILKFRKIETLCKIKSFIFSKIWKYSNIWREILLVLVILNVTLPAELCFREEVDARWYIALP